MSNAKSEQARDPEEIVALNAKVPHRLRSAMLEFSRRGPEIRIMAGAACLMAMRLPREKRMAWVDAYDQWIADGCPEIKVEHETSEDVLDQFISDSRAAGGSRAGAAGRKKRHV